MERLRPLFADLGLTWRDRFGFSNDYVLTMRPERAQALGVRTIGDLARLPEVRFAVDEDFTKRPLDGLGALVRRYGLRQGTTVTHKIAEAGAKDRIIQALLQDDADVAELFRTDPQIEEYGLVVLEDDLRFFPVYEPAPLARADALQRFPAVAAALARLDGKITSEAMRRMNAEVDLNGQAVRSVALGFLIDQGLLQEPNTAAATGGEAVTIAVDAADSSSGPAGQALRATRTAFPKRAVEVRQTHEPLAEVASGRARLGVTTADAFFMLRGDRAVPVGGAEALGVLGYKLAHVITRRDGPASLDAVRRLGAGQAGGASDRTARFVLGAHRRRRGGEHREQRGRGPGRAVRRPDQRLGGRDLRHRTRGRPCDPEADGGRRFQAAAARRLDLGQRRLALLVPAAGPDPGRHLRRPGRARSRP